jgi:hypothetical protein
MKAAYQTLAYAKTTSDLTITYELPTSLAERNKLFAACDAGFGACRETRRSQEGGITFLNGGFIYAKSKRGLLVTLSTARLNSSALSALPRKSSTNATFLLTSASHNLESPSQRTIRLLLLSLSIK